MKETPILFSTPMVQAILAGMKTQTRRIVKLQPTKQWAVDKWAKVGPGAVDASDLTAADMEMDELISNCRYGQPGDVLWVKETFYAYGWWIREVNKWRFRDFTLEEMAGSYHYMDNPPAVIIPKRKEKELGWYKRPSLFMPRHASRITLEVKEVEIERLQDISEGDAIAEGITPLLASSLQIAMNGQLYLDYSKPKELFNDGLPAIDSYRTLWESINGPDSWSANPWVWVISFEVISIKSNKE